MNTDNDYDNDGNNIVPCPICLSEHCPSKEGGKCPDEDEFVEAMNQSQPEKIEYVRLLKTAPITDTYFREGTTFYSEDYVVNLLLKTRTAEQERVVGIVEAEKKKHHCPPDDGNDYDQGAWETLTNITEAIRGNENQHGAQ